MLRAMLKKEFILILRDKHALAALFVMPSIFILIMSMALKDTFNSDRAFIRYTVIDKDQTSISLKIATFLKENTVLQEYEGKISSQEQLEQALNSGLHFALTIPRGYSAQFTQKKSDRILQLDVASDVKQDMLALFKGELRAVIIQLQVQKMLQELEPLLPGLTARSEAVRLHKNELEVHFNGLRPDQHPTSTQQSVPSWIVFGMFFIIIPMSTIFINERKQNTLMRMQSMNVSIPLLFTGKIVPYMIINQLQAWLMIAVGMFIVPLLGAAPLTLGNSLPGLFMVSAGLSLAAIGTSILIAVSVNSVEQATTIGGLINILFGAIGGVMVPKFFMPPGMQTLSNISPMSWGLEGFLDIFLRNSGTGAVLIESLALAGFGIILLLTAWLIFGHRTKNGL
ncbi:ABC-type multidrug transport system, permease component [Desulfocapsa sulfexigens DSM 10523]|uniref:ABC-type multidrug transport system, permease component n=1 Tax=Desulfocapsa sulfexigens (strain DSM 10523 / SB164P1) TaxID=1167006 RepID=M1PEH5_DESSD|nr:ABC transporter permease [Desulfocapsa sulfexigens]AGF78120.1 ABC-type multidrug transport system, permease component [Desulfocapsa sulfexigens DSM 10523]